MLHGLDGSLNDWRSDGWRILKHAPRYYIGNRKVTSYIHIQQLHLGAEVGSAGDIDERTAATQICTDESWQY